MFIYLFLLELGQLRNLNTLHDSFGSWKKNSRALNVRIDDRFVLLIFESNLKQRIAEVYQILIKNYLMNNYRILLDIEKVVR